MSLFKGFYRNRRLSLQRALNFFVDGYGDSNYSLPSSLEEVTSGSVNFDPITALSTIVTDSSTSPTTSHISLQGDTNAVRVFLGNPKIDEDSFYLYVRINGGSAIKIKMYRYTGRIINAPTGASLSFGTSDGRSIDIASMTVPEALESISGTTGTANCDTAGPPLWEPSAAHITLADYNSAFILESDGTERIIFISEYDGTNWTEPRFIRLPTSTDIKVRCTYKEIALASYEGDTVDITAPSGATIGGTSAVMTFGDTATGSTLNVTANSESDLRDKIAAAVAGDEIVIPAGTYTLTVNVTDASFTANVLAGNVGGEGIIIRGATGDRADVVIIPNNDSSGFYFTGTGSTEYAVWKDLTINGNSGTSINLTWVNGKIKFENVRFTGCAGQNNISLIQQSTDIMDARFLFCQSDTSGKDCYNIHAQKNAQTLLSTFQFIACTGHTSGSASQDQILTSHDNANYELYGGSFSNSVNSVIAQDGAATSTAKAFAFFTTVTPGARNGGVSDTANYFCSITGTGGSSQYPLAPVFSTGLKMTSAYIRVPNGTSYPSTPLIAFWKVGSSTRCYHSSIGGLSMSWSVLTAATGEAIRHTDYTAGSTANSNFYNNTFYSNPTALGLTSTTLPWTLINNATFNNTTGINVSAASNALGTSNYNCFDTPVDADLTQGANDVAGDGAINSTTFFPTASGNSDGSGTTSIYDWVGGIDIWGFIARHKSTIISRGAREIPAIYADAELFPDYWI